MERQTTNVIDLFGSRTALRSTLAAIVRVRFCAVLSNRLFLRLVVGEGFYPRSLERYTFHCVTESGESLAHGVRRVVIKPDGGVLMCTCELLPAVADRSVTERCDVVLRVPEIGAVRLFTYRPHFADKPASEEE